jgi:hypothetical protein
VRANELGGELTASHFAGLGVVLMSSQEYRAARARTETGQSGSASAPCALVTFSHVGFDSDGAWAALIVNQSCGPGCGGPAYWLLKRTAAGWDQVCVVDQRRG